MLVSSEDSASRPFFAAVERRLSKQAFETWFRPLRVTRSPAERVLRIAVPNPAVRDWILSQYSTALQESLLEIDPPGCKIEWATPVAGRGGSDLDSAAGLTSVGCDSRENPVGVGAVPPEVPDIPSAPL